MDPEDHTVHCLDPQLFLEYREQANGILYRDFVPKHKAKSVKCDFQINTRLEDNFDVPRGKHKDQQHLEVASVRELLSVDSAGKYRRTQPGEDPSPCHLSGFSILPSVPGSRA